MIKTILTTIVFLFLLFPVMVNSDVKDLEKDINIDEVIKGVPVSVFVGLVSLENLTIVEPLVFFEDRIITDADKEGYDYYPRLTTDPYSGTIFSFVAALHFYKPNMLYRVVYLDVYELDIDSVGEAELKYKHYLEAYTIFYEEIEDSIPGTDPAATVNENTLPIAVFKRVLKEFEKKHSGEKNPLRNNHVFRGID